MLCNKLSGLNPQFSLPISTCLTRRNSVCKFWRFFNLCCKNYRNAVYFDCTGLLPYSLLILTGPFKKDSGTTSHDKLMFPRLLPHWSGITKTLTLMSPDSRDPSSPRRFFARTHASLRTGKLSSTHHHHWELSSLLLGVTLSTFHQVHSPLFFLLPNTMHDLIFTWPKKCNTGFFYLQLTAEPIRAVFLWFGSF